MGVFNTEKNRKGVWEQFDDHNGTSSFVLI